MFQCSIVESRPGTTNQEWHSDGPHRGAAAGWDTAAATTHADSGAMTDDADACDDDGSHFEACAPPYAVCAFVPLLSPAGRRFGSGVGATQFWPGSHAYDQLLGFGGAARIDNRVGPRSSKCASRAWKPVSLMPKPKSHFFIVLFACWRGLCILRCRNHLQAHGACLDSRFVLARARPLTNCNIEAWVVLFSGFRRWQAVAGALEPPCARVP